MTIRSRRFPLVTVLYVTTGGTPGLVDSRGLEQVQGLLAHMTGHPIFLNQIPRAVDVCQKYLVDQYPWLADLQPTPAQCQEPRKLANWVTRAIAARGDDLNVAAMPGGTYHYMTAAEEFGHQMAEGRGAFVAAGAIDGT